MSDFRVILDLDVASRQEARDLVSSLLNGPVGFLIADHEIQETD